MSFVGYCYGNVHVHVTQYVNSQINNLGNLSMHKTSSYTYAMFQPRSVANITLKTNRPGLTGSVL